MKIKILFLFILTYPINYVLLSQSDLSTEKEFIPSLLEYDLFAGISKHNVSQVRNSLKNGADINQINPLNGNSPLKAALVQYNKLLSEKFGWKTKAAIAGISISSAIVFNIMVDKKFNEIELLRTLYSNKIQSKEECIVNYGKKFETVLASAFMQGAALTTFIAAVILAIVNKRKLSSALGIINIILSNPNLIIDQDSIDFCIKNLPKMKKNLDKVLDKRVEE